jgi:ketosteroid isomerase-like protein
VPGTRASQGRSDVVVLRWAHAFNARDLDGMLACAAEQIDLHPLRLRGLATRYRGRDGVREWFARLRQAHHEYRISVSQVRDLGGGKVFASGLLSLGDESDVGPICMLHQLDGEMIVTAREYLSDPDTIERLGLIP